MLFPEPVIPITAISMSSGLSGVDAVDRFAIFAIFDGCPPQTLNLADGSEANIEQIPRLIRDVCVPVMRERLLFNTGIRADAE